MQNLNFKSVTFFYPSKIIGGAELLFFRLTLYLINVHNIKVSYIDYFDGVVRKMFQDQNVKIDFLEYKGYNRFELNPDTILITPLSSIFDVKMYFKGDFKIFFWSLHPSGLSDSIKSNLRQKKIGKLLTNAGSDLDFLIQKKGVYFMDETNLEYQKDIFHFNNTPDFFVPIFCDKRIGKRKSVTENETHLGWVGRLSDDKIFSLHNIVDHSIAFAKENPIHNLIIHIIGNGGKKNIIEQITLPDNVKIIFLGTLLGEQLTDYANTYFDLVFAMGTSALEMASMKKPVVLLDFQYTIFQKNNKFRWLFEVENYNVAEKFHENLPRHLSFNDLMKLVRNKNHYTIGEKCYDYIENYHSINAVGDVIINGLNQSILFFSDLKKTDFKIARIIKYLRFVKRYLKKQ